MGGQAWGISGNGNIVYVSWPIDVDNTPEFIVATYDISQSSPRLLSTVTANPTLFGYYIQVIGNILLADSQVYDISNVTPVPIGTLPLPMGTVWGVEGNNVLASGGSANYLAVDISSPSTPVVRANVADLLTWDIFNPRSAAWASNGRFYAADGTGGFAVYNVASSGGPAAVTEEPIFEFIYDQVIEQQTLYAAALEPSGAGGLAVFDLSNGAPNLIGSLLYPNDSSFAIQVSGSSAFLGLADSLKILDASNPQAPTEIGSVPVPVNALALSGSTLFAGTGDGHLVVFDVSTPASPKQIASVTMPAPVTMRLSGTLLLVAAGPAGLLVFDVSHPGAPAMLSQFSPSPSAPVWDVLSLGSAAMLATDSSGVVTVDLSNPSRPQQLYQQQLPFLNGFPAPNTAAGILPAFSLSTQNGLTYLGTTAGIMFTFDAAIPAVPRLIAVNVVGADDTEIVSVMTPGGSSLYLAVQGVNVQLDNSVPQNSIELYYPPAALSNAVTINAATSPNGPALNPKQLVMSRRLAAISNNPDHFGSMRTRRGKRSTK